MYEKQFSVEKQNAAMNRLVRQSGGDKLEFMHQVAASGRGVQHLASLFPSADPAQLRYWCETNEYKV